jgi:hypothetical protein
MDSFDTRTKAECEESKAEWLKLLASGEESYTCVICKEETTIHQIQQYRDAHKENWWKLLPADIEGDKVCFMCYCEYSMLDAGDM